MAKLRGQADLVPVVVSVVFAAIVAYLGIYLFSELNQAITIAGPLAGTGQEVLTDAAEALVMGVGGTGLLVTIVLLLRGAGGR